MFGRKEFVKIVNMLINKHQKKKEFLVKFSETFYLDWFVSADLLFYPDGYNGHTLHEKYLSGFEKEYDCFTMVLDLITMICNGKNWKNSNEDERFILYYIFFNAGLLSKGLPVSFSWHSICDFYAQICIDCESCDKFDECHIDRNPYNSNSDNWKSHTVNSLNELYDYIRKSEQYILNKEQFESILSQYKKWHEESQGWLVDIDNLLGKSASKLFKKMMYEDVFLLALSYALDCPKNKITSKYLLEHNTDDIWRDLKG